MGFVSLSPMLSYTSNATCWHPISVGLSSRNYNNVSLPFEVNPAYDQFSTPGSKEKTSKFVGSHRENSLTDLNIALFQNTKHLQAESPITPDTPQGFDHTPLLSKQGRAGNPRSIPAIQVEVEQERVQFSTSTSSTKVIRTSVSPRPRPRSQGAHSDSRLSAGPTQPHSSTLQPAPFTQDHLKPVAQAQPSPRTKHAQKYIDSLTASATPKSKRQYSPALERKKDAAKMKGSASSPGKLRHLNLDAKKTVEKDSKQQLEEDWSETLNFVDEVLKSL